MFTITDMLKLILNVFIIAKLIEIIFAISIGYIYMFIYAEQALIELTKASLINSLFKIIISFSFAICIEIFFLLKLVSK